MPLSRERIKKALAAHTITVLTVVGVLIGVVLGFILRTTKTGKWWSKREVMYVQFVGDLYLRILKCLILPLMISAIISSVGSLKLQTSWKIAARSVAWFLSTKYLAVVEGIILVIIVRPGSGVLLDGHQPLNSTKNVLVADTVLDIFRNVFPPNIVEASVVQYQTVLVPPGNNSIPLWDWEITFQSHDGVNILGLITFSLLLGLAVAVMTANAQPIVNFFECLGQCMMIAINWVLWISPLGVTSLVTAKLIEVENLGSLIERLGLYFMTVLIGLFLHGLMVLPAIYFFLTRKSPFRFLGHLSKTLITAFGTASSTAALPVTMECLERRCKLDPRIVKFTVTLGSTLNMDGTALYEAVAVVFIAQVRQVDLNLGELVLVSVTVTAACLAGAGVPQAGLMTLVMILSALGLAPEDVSLIIAVDWLLDRFRTTVNVMGEAFSTAVVEHYSVAELHQDAAYSPVSQDDLELPERSLPVY